MSPRPADECPYRRPFPPGFSACPTYRPAINPGTPLDVERPDWTCAHLDVGSRETVGRFYARCSLGTAADRNRRAGIDAGVDHEEDRELSGRNARRAPEAGPTAS